MRAAQTSAPVVALAAAMAIAFASTSGVRSATSRVPQNHDRQGMVAAPAVHAAPPLVRFHAPPYGSFWGYRWGERRMPVPVVSADADYRASVFHVVDAPAESDGDRFPGLDTLIALMGHQGVPFYRSDADTPESGPDGIVGADDVVVVKINYQWGERGGTNVDLLRGLVRRIVDHPDGFVGEIVVCENAQFVSINFDRPENNAENIGLSPHDVVAAFQDQSIAISHFNWTTMRFTEVAEYADGDDDDGYVLLPYDAALNGRVSYPKFTTAYGTRISLRNGVWDPASGSYDRSHLRFVNMPVLKSHHAVYGITSVVKNYMGVVTGGLGTNSHNAIANGLLGAAIAEVHPADLNILDCIWVNANPNTGPATTYEGATRRDELVASLDPVAADIWAATNILVPAFVQNGFPPPWAPPNPDPADPTSVYRNYLDHSLARLLAAGWNATNDLAKIDVYTWSAGGDVDQDGVPDTDDNCPYDANPDQMDCDGDGIGDVCAIAQGLQADLNGNGIPDACECPADLDGNGAVDGADLGVLLGAWGPNPGHAADLDLDCTVGGADLGALLGAWGSCGG
ncbi:MAG: DUF362 domain-containing protein [Phycisphaerales bacterium]|nr:DUF362 domain-containing protein [Phycisphaerales bacterium]